MSIGNESIPAHNYGAAAYEALNLAKQNTRDIEGHEDICAERYAGIHKAIDEIKGTIKWAGTTAFGIIIAMLGFMLVQQLNANGKINDDNQRRIDSLQGQLTEERANRVIRVTPPKE